MTLRILSGNGALQIMPFRKLGGKCHFFLRFCTRKRSKTYVIRIYYFTEKLSTDRVKLVTETIQKLQNFVRGIQKMELDATEFAYMKALALFSPGMSLWIKKKHFSWHLSFQ